ncbi:MAG: tyrosine-type recombinase/integrase [Rikenellaceae bacterium]
MAKTKGKLTTADYLPIEEFERLVEGLRNDNQYLWELYCRLSFCTALRASDVLSLTWGDIFERDSFDKQEKKTGKARRITLNKSVQNKITDLYRLLKTPSLDQVIFLNSRSGKPYTIEYINRLLKLFRIKYRLPIKAFSTHTFRKTFGRYVYETNGRSAESLILLNSIFRHSSFRPPRSTSDYAKLRLMGSLTRYGFRII